MKNNSNQKQVIVVRTDLDWKGFGKLPAQVAHASLGAAVSKSFIMEGSGNKRFLAIPLTTDNEEWWKEKFTKVVCRCDSEAELIALYEAAKKAGLECVLIKDAAHTVFTEPTLTTVGIGPGPIESIDKITKHLKLL